MLIGGAMAGLAGVARVHRGAAQAIDLGFPSGYGFTAIIVAFLGRLHPIGCLIAGIVLAVTYVGGQMAQTTVHIPDATAGIFQAMMLFFILASDILIRYRVRLVRRRRRARRSMSMDSILHRGHHHHRRPDDADPAGRARRTGGRKERAF